MTCENTSAESAIHFYGELMPTASSGGQLDANLNKRWSVGFRTTDLHWIGAFSPWADRANRDSLGRYPGL